MFCRVFHYFAPVAFYFKFTSAGPDEPQSDKIRPLRRLRLNFVRCVARAGIHVHVSACSSRLWMSTYRAYRQAASLLVANRARCFGHFVAPDWMQNDLLVYHNQTGRRQRWCAMIGHYEAKIWCQLLWIFQLLGR